MNFYPFHIGDYISHTSHLTDAEDLAYRRMIDLYYQAEKPFSDVELLARKVKTTVKIVETLLQEFFEKTAEGYINKRCDEEIAKYRAMQNGGRKGAAIRWGKGSDSPPNATPMPTKNQEPRTINQEPIIEVAKAPKAQRLKLEELPNDWQAFCKTERPDLNPQSIWNQFKDYWIAQGGQKGAKLDWFATWRNWVRNQKSVVNYTTDKPAQKWDASLAGVIAKGQELGILPKTGETEGQYRERVRMGRASL
jgi:uncharacterized protein YdaU (DUF1376 family)